MLARRFSRFRELLAYNDQGHVVPGLDIDNGTVFQCAYDFSSFARHAGQPERIDCIHVLHHQ